MEITETLKKFGKSLFRKKSVPCNPLATDLVRCLGLLDLTYLSIGAMIGVGVYVTMGQITREAGPSIVLSYFLGGCASVLSALCYAELASRIPIAGSSYQFTYMAMGEFWGFFVGWNIALEHAIGSAAISRAVSGYIDSLIGNVIRNYLEVHTPMPGGFLATYPDFLSAGYIMLIVTLLAFGVKLSSRTNIFFATLNLLICGCIIVSALILGDTSYWADVGHGGFFPHGFSATLSGAATLIFAYIGYEVVGAAAEEAENPRRNIPLSLMISIFGVMLIYTCVAASFVSLVPWYNASISAPFSEVYEAHGWHWANYMISVGIIVASTAANIAATLAVPRYLFSMARDGLLMEFLAKVNKYTEVPVYATIVGGAWCVLLTLIFSLKDLIDFMSIGQLIACIFVAMIVIKLRYQPFEPRYENCAPLLKPPDESSERSKLLDHIGEPELETVINTEDGVKIGTLRKNIRSSRIGPFLRWTDSFKPGNIPVVLMYIASAFSTALLSMLLFDFANVAKWWYIILIILFGIIVIVCLTFMMMFQQDDNITTYKIPFAPLSPFTSIVVNTALMMKLHVETWIRLGVWMGIGLIVYFGYGYRHSKARKLPSDKEENENVEMDDKNEEEPSVSGKN